VPGRVDVRLMTLAASALALGVTGIVTPGAAQQHHHPLHRDFYREWKQPGSDLSCCNARVERDGVEVGDCEPTRAEVRGGAWWAWLRQEGRWIPVPDGKILRERNPGGQDGQLCWTPASGVLCFVPPDTGG